VTQPSRRRILIAAVAGVVVVALALVAYQLGRRTPDTGTTPTPTTPAAASTGQPTYSPTDEHGSPEPALPAGPVRAGEGGTTTGPAELPLGYPHDRDGAVAAATNYLIWMNSLRITDKTTADALAAATAVDTTTRQALIESFDQLRTGMNDLTQDQPQPARGAYAIATYTDDQALIYIWAPEVTTDNSGQTEHTWSIDAVPVLWSNNDWKLDGALMAKTGGAAIDPLDPAGNPSAEEKHSILSRTPADPGEITDSADQAWFEYANAPR
jgi:hypothetical protein